MTQVTSVKWEAWRSRSEKIDYRQVNRYLRISESSDYVRGMFKGLIEKLGTVVLGVDIHSNLKDHVRGWTEMSKNMFMTGGDEQIYGGVQFGINSRVKVIDVNGFTRVIHISSKE